MEHEEAIQKFPERCSVEVCSQSEIDAVLQRIVSELFKKARQKSFQVCGPYGLCVNIWLCHLSMKAATDNT